MTKKRSAPPPQENESTGTYAFDKELGKVVKVSTRIPSVSSKGKDGFSSDDAPSLPCGRDSCSGGGCGMGGGGFGGDF